MENWGMVNYREAYLLYDQQNTNVLDRLFIATIMAHELAHKWFGNLVTCFWWSNLWLNESFASFFEYFSAHEAEPWLELDDRFILNRVQSALSGDASASIQPMNWSSVADNPSISAHFGTSSYAKGASVLRMLEHFVTPVVFRNALRYYLKDNAYGIGYPTNMYAAFRRAVSEDPTFAMAYPGIDIGTVFDGWVQNAGAPVVEVNVNMTSGLVSLTQRRFQISGTPRNDIWQIPISWTHGDSPNFQSTAPTYVLTQRTGSVQKPTGTSWVVLNIAQSGFYRVNYDNQNWGLLAAQLRSNKDVIHKLSRSQIVNDVLFFIRAGQISIPVAFDVLSFLAKETDYYVWNGALTQLEWIHRRLKHLPAAYDEFTAYLLDLIDEAVKQIGYADGANDSASTIQQRMQILNFACNLGHQGCIDDSLAKWNSFRTQNTPVQISSRRYVYCVGLRNGNASDYQFLFQKYNTSENTADMVVMLRTLACSKDQASIEHYLYQTMHNDKIRVHDRNNAFSFALQGNSENLQTVLNFLFKNYAEIRETYGGAARLSNCISALSGFLTDFEDIVKFQSWLYENQIAIGESFSTGVSENLTQIVLHQNVVSIDEVSVLDAAERPVSLQIPNPFTIDRYYEIVTINFASEIVPGTYIITINYKGRINENPHDRGLYKGYYYYNNEKRYYATTQFQPYHARKAFPCFDEPQFKCPFTITITRGANLRPSFSNMAIANTTVLPSGRVQERFYPTPVVSSYLVAFHVSDFVSTNSSGTVQKPFQIISREGPTNQHSYAADVGFKITEIMESYFNISYYEMGQGRPMKNDHIALPDFPSGAMENWGMVNYREAYLLYDEQNTNLQNRIFIATIIAHELAHKWFGNLVTCFWWSNLWLNESFASFFEFFSAHEAEPWLELDDIFILDSVQSALSGDASASIQPMNWSSVADNPSISAHFGTSSYAKGASVLRMLEHFVTPVVFRNALRYYLKENSYGIGYPTDMYAAFRRAVSEDPTFATAYPGIDIGTVFDGWVQNAGAPVVEVNVNMTSGLVSLTQRRFQISGTPPNDIWQIPISWTHGDSPNFQNTRPTYVLTQRTGSVQKPVGTSWVVLNIAQSGFYRVNYDNQNWGLIAAQLRSNKDVIHKLSRSQIVNDVLFFIRAGQISIPVAFDVLSFLAKETDYYVWNGALTQLQWIHRRLEHLPAAYDEFTAYLLELIDEAVKQIGYADGANDSVSTIQQRMQILNFACNLGHQGCIDDSLAKWNSFRTQNTPVQISSRRYVYCVGLRNGNASDYQFLFQKYNTSENTADMVVMLRTLACSKDQASIEHYLYQTMHSDKIRVHDKNNAFSYALQGNSENLQTVLNFLFNNYAEIRETYGGAARLSNCISALSGFLTDFEDIVKFQSWLYENQIAIGESFSTGVSVVNTAVNNLRWGNNVAAEIFSELRSRSSATTATTSLFVVMLALAAKFVF
ncbi:unnamed protein product [Pieris macdunnoughi]|uniref:Aminopeptidase n=1 Tax=Pieris macdunnoughi TaxID=345717 RepID=A0A821YI95_9NEOP|nr:unnamed protein product [Pieris macdunnoughi]